MIREWIEALRTPATKEARRLGYLYESIALRERYRRCEASWRHHIAKCHEETLSVVDRSSANRCMLALGSGLLVEIPMADLLRRFARIVLVDFVHPREVRRRWGVHPRVSLLEIDLLGIAAPLLKWSCDTSDQKLPVPMPPTALNQYGADFVLSANCLSQLALKPRQHLERKVESAKLDQFCEQLARAHLTQVKELAPDKHLVISDYETRVLDLNGNVVDRATPFFDQQVLSRHTSWNWLLAPRGEASRHQSIEMSVGAFTVSI